MSDKLKQVIQNLINDDKVAAHASLKEHFITTTRSIISGSASQESRRHAHKHGALSQLRENIEDEQSELTNEFDELIKSAKKVLPKDMITRFRKQFDEVNEAFASAYYNDDEDEESEGPVEGALQDMEDVISELKRAVANAKKRVKEASSMSKVHNSSSVLQESRRHVSAARIKSVTDFGSEEENPAMVRTLRFVLDLLGKKVPEDKVYSYDSDEYEVEFQKHLIDLGVPVSQVDDLRSGPKKIDVTKHEFEFIKKMSSGDLIFRKGNAVLITSDDAPSMLIMADEPK